jgi:hypothetical protein
MPQPRVAEHDSGSRHGINQKGARDDQSRRE